MQTLVKPPNENIHENWYPRKITESTVILYNHKYYYMIRSLSFYIQLKKIQISV